MNYRKSLAVAFLLSFFLILATAGAASVVPTAKASADAAATQTASGTVTSVNDTSLVLNSEGKDLTFELRADTKIEGKIAQGAKATVEYRVEEGKNIAVRVTVSASS